MFSNEIIIYLYPFHNSFCTIYTTVKSSKTFGLKTHWNHKSRIVHNVVIASERGFNHKIERLHNSIRERTKTTRGFHGCLESAYGV